MKVAKGVITIIQKLFISSIITLVYALTFGKIGGELFYDTIFLSMFLYLGYIFAIYDNNLKNCFYLIRFKSKKRFFFYRCLAVAQKNLVYLAVTTLILYICTILTKGILTPNHIIPYIILNYFGFFILNTVMFLIEIYFNKVLSYAISIFYILIMNIAAYFLDNINQYNVFVYGFLEEFNYFNLSLLLIVLFSTVFCIYIFRRKDIKI